MTRVDKGECEGENMVLINVKLRVKVKLRVNVW